MPPDRAIAFVAGAGSGGLLRLGRVEIGASHAGAASAGSSRSRSTASASVAGRRPTVRPMPCDRAIAFVIAGGVLRLGRSEVGTCRLGSRSGRAIAVAIQDVRVPRTLHRRPLADRSNDAP